MVCELFGFYSISEHSAVLYHIKEECDLLAVCRETLAYVMGPALQMLLNMSNFLLTIPLTFVELYM